jgi:hypothetical protein
MGIRVMQASQCVPRRTTEVEHGGLIFEDVYRDHFVKFSIGFSRNPTIVTKGEYSATGICQCSMAIFCR